MQSKSKLSLTKSPIMIYKKTYYFSYILAMLCFTGCNQLPEVKVQSVTNTIRNFPWQKVLDDKAGDGAGFATADGKSLSIYHDKITDSLWFKFETYTPISEESPAISVSIDTDGDQSTGIAWYGSNKKFKVDVMLSCGPTRKGERYFGYNGLTDSNGIQHRNWLNVKQGNLSFYLDSELNAYYLAIKRTDILKSGTTFNFIGSVGDDATWNDDIGANGEYATFTLR